MNKKDYLKKVRKEIQFIFDRDAIENELSNHIEDSIQDLMKDGLSFEEAESVAISQMGDPVEVGKQLNQEHHPILGYTWIISKVVASVMVIPLIFLSCYFAYDILKLATPCVVRENVEKIKVDLDYQLPTCDVSIDYICKMEDGSYYLTYRTWKDFSYSHAGWNTHPFSLFGSEGKYMYGGGYQSAGFIGTQGYDEFTWPDDDLLVIVFRDGHQIELDLGEISNE